MILTRDLQALLAAAEACADKQRPSHLPCEPFPVGEYIEDELKARGWTTRDCAERMGGEVDVDELTLDLHIAAAHAEESHIICHGRMGQTTADRLGRAFGVDGQTFMNLDAAYHWTRFIAKADPATVAAIVLELIAIRESVERQKESGTPT